MPAGQTPLHYACLHGRLAVAEQLLQRGALLSATDTRGGLTPLHLAADAGHCDVVARLQALGADLEATSTRGLTPLALAMLKVGAWLLVRPCWLMLARPGWPRPSLWSRAGGQGLAPLARCV